MRRLTDETCKNIIKHLAKKLGVEAKLITTRLMSEDDKNDMRNGDLPTESLECHIRVWMKAGCPDYAHGNTDPMKDPPVLNDEKRSEPNITSSSCKNRVLTI